jgi:hypothetical protein
MLNCKRAAEEYFAGRHGSLVQLVSAIRLRADRIRVVRIVQRRALRVRALEALDEVDQVLASDLLARPMRACERPLRS